MEELNDSSMNWRRRKFTSEEDAILRREAEGKEKVSWVKIAKLLPGRNSSQCRDRYINYLSKEITNLPWTVEEDMVIIQQYRNLGRKWVKIAKMLPGRSGNNVKNRWYRYLSYSSNRHKVYNQSREKKTVDCKTAGNRDKLIMKEMGLELPIDSPYIDSIRLISSVFDIHTEAIECEYLNWYYQ